MRNEDSGGTPVISTPVIGTPVITRPAVNRPVPRPAHRGPQPARLVRTAPEQPGPLPLDIVRRNIAGDRPGVPLMLRIRVLDAVSGFAVTGAVVELRHRDPGGAQDLRGAQVTDADGYTEFRTVHPGREPGQAVRINAEVHVGGVLAGGRADTYAGPLFIPEQIAGQIAAGPGPAEEPRPAVGGVLHAVPRDRFELTAGLLATVTVAIED